MKHFTLIIKVIFIFFFQFALSSCSKSSLSIPDYIGYVRSADNGLTDFTVRNGYVFNVLYEPADYLALKELRNEKVTVDKFFETRKKFSDYLYFDFSIKSETSDKKVLDKNDSLNYEKHYNHFAFDFSKDIFLLTKEDTLRCLLHQLINSGDISPEYHFEVLFEKPDSLFISCDSLVLVYDDKVLNSGKVIIPILTKDIKNVPQLKI